ncbi:MAG: hypothetical protein Q4C01_02295 [Clostridia bacterium]|nr:hypothetical protein [Clostridia bacterium]
MFGLIFKSRIKHHWVFCLAKTLLPLALLLVLAILSGLRVSQDETLESAYETIAVRCDVCARGASLGEKLNINTDIFTVENHEGFLTPYVKNLLLCRSLQAALSEDEAEELSKNGTAAEYTVTGINAFAAFRGLVNSESNVNFSDGYDESSLKSLPIVIVPEAMEVSETVELFIVAENSFTYERSVIELELVVGGTHSYPENRLFCSFEVLNGELEKIGMGNRSDSLSFELCDAKGHAEFREFAEGELDRLYAVKYSAHAGYDVIVHDEELKAVINTVNRNKLLLGVLIPFYHVLSCALGVLTGFGSVKSRKHELILYRLIGMGRGRLFLTVFLEQVIFSGLALLLFIALCPLARLPLPWLGTALLLVLYYAGSALPLVRYLLTPEMKLIPKSEN